MADGSATAQEVALPPPTGDEPVAAPAAVPDDVAAMFDLKKKKKKAKKVKKEVRDTRL